MHLAAFCRDLSCPPGRNSSAVAGCNGIVRQPLSKLPGHNLWVHRFITARATFFHDLPPVLHSGLRFLKELAIGISLEQGKERLQDPAAIADEANLNRIT